MIKNILSFILISMMCVFQFGCSNSKHQIDDEKLLQELDLTIEERTKYNKTIEDQINSFNKILDYSSNKNPQVTFELLGKLFNIYRSYKVDKAKEIAQQRLQVAQQLDSACIKEALMNNADVLHKLGNYHAASEILQKIPFDSTTYNNSYFHYLRQAISLSLSNDTHKNNLILNNEQSTYHKDAMQANKPGTYGYVSNLYKQNLLEGDTVGAIQLLEKFYTGIKSDSLEPNKASIEYEIANLYLMHKDTVKAKHYLILSSLTDLKNAKKVYMSLQDLAMLLFYQGDIERAYNYILCALEDINFGHATYRFTDILAYLLIISAANEMRIKKNEKQFVIFISVLSILILLLVTAFILLKKRTSKLEEAQNILKQQNQHLTELSDNLKLMNEQIKEKDHIQEEYIGLLFNVCSEHLKKQNTLYKGLNRIVSNGRIADLSKFIGEQQSSSDDFKDFIHKFDTIFLNLFPHFIEDFNQLLRPEERIHPKDGDLLTPELRIYALMRLGIQDNAKIASFLHYSLQTVYNYRMKMRNKAIPEKKDLISQVQLL